MQRSERSRSIPQQFLQSTTGLVTPASVAPGQLSTAPTENKDEYEVESILAHRSLQGGKKKYLVKWKGYTFEECTWEPQANFNGDALQVYHKALKEAKHEDSASEDDDSEDQ